LTAIFSRDDLTINGNGSLTVTAHYRHGIVSKDDLRITGGQITVTSVNDGIRGRDSIAVKDGTITVQSGGDGMQANNDEGSGKRIISPLREAPSPSPHRKTASRPGPALPSAEAQ